MEPVRGARARRCFFVGPSGQEGLKRPVCTSRGRRDAGTWGSRDAQRCSTCNMNFGDLEAGNGFWNLEDFRGTLVSSCQCCAPPGHWSVQYLLTRRNPILPRHSVCRTHAARSICRQWTDHWCQTSGDTRPPRASLCVERATPRQAIMHDIDHSGVLTLAG